MLELGNPREEGVSPQVCRAKRMQMEKAVTQHTEGDREPSPEAGWMVAPCKSSSLLC